MRWLATAACARLAFMTRDHPSRFVPQSVGTSRDSACDPDTVLKEVFKDGDTAYVTFSTGPETFTVDWPGCHRPGGALRRDTDGGPARPHADAWLDNLDVAAFTHTDDGGTHHAPDAADCATTLALLRKHSGALTAVFLYACGAADVSLGWQSPNTPALKGSSFRNAMQDAKVISEKMPAHLIEACFLNALAGGGPLDVDESAAAGGGDSVVDGAHHAAPAAAAAPVTRMSLIQFAAALVLVATTRCVQGADTTPPVVGSHVSASRWVATAVEKLIVNSLLNFLGARVTRSIQLMTLLPPNADVAAVQTSRRPHLLALLARIPRSRPTSDSPQCSLACLAAFLHKEELVLQAPPPAGSAAPAATPVVPNSKLTQAALGAMHRHHPDVTTFPAVSMPLALDADGLESILLALAALHTSDGEAASPTLAQALTTLLDTCCARLGIATQ